MRSRQSTLLTSFLASNILAASLLALTPGAAHAQRITYAFETWEKSKNTPTSFTIAAKYMPAVWGKAQDLITTLKDKNMSVMNIRHVTDNLIDTYNPTAIGQVGFHITNVKKGEDYEIKIDALSYEGNMFATSGEHKDAAKRARLISYLLQDYLVKEAPTEAASTIAATSPAGPALKPELEAMLTSIRALIAANQNDAAISQLEILKTLLANPADKSAEKAPKTPTVPASDTSTVKTK